MPFPIPDARLAAMLGEDVPYGDVTVLGIGVGAPWPRRVPRPRHHDGRLRRGGGAADAARGLRAGGPLRRARRAGGGRRGGARGPGPRGDAALRGPGGADPGGERLWRRGAGAPHRLGPGSPSLAPASTCRAPGTLCSRPSWRAVACRTGSACRGACWCSRSTAPSSAAGRRTSGWRSCAPSSPSAKSRWRLGTWTRRCDSRTPGWTRCGSTSCRRTMPRPLCGRSPPCRAGRSWRPPGGVNENNAAAYARAGADLLVTSAPYAAPPTDVAVTMAPEGT